MILSEGRNCWRIAHAARAAFLIDGDAYFTAFRAAALRARESIVIVGWDLDSRERLGRGGGGPTSGPSDDDDDLPAALVPFLNELLTRRPGLQVHVLVWDFSMIFAFEREPLPTYQFALRAHPRLHFHMDGVHPVGASHHQKVVVVDDAVAFAGGIDLTKCRWDTPEHRAVDPRRVDPGGKPYGPIHDVQMVVDGEAAAALGELVRWRWNQATGQPLAVPARRSKRAFADARDDDGWPPGLRPDVQDVPIAIARTLPAYEDRPAASEVHQLVLDAIAAARRFLYVENQYLTSASVGEALAGRLRDEQGPEVVLVLPRFECGWLEQSSMGVLRARMLAHLRNADRHCRLHVYYPTVPGLPSDGCVNVHAKILVVDDRLLRIGSSNLSNRSMGFDTECDLAIEAQTEGGETARAIAGLRNRLLGEHLGVSPDEVAVATAAQGSLVAAIESLRGRPPRTLEPLAIPPGASSDPGAGLAVNLAVLDGLVCDPEPPGAPEKIIEQFVPPKIRKPARGALFRFGIVVAAILGLAALWHLTSLRHLLDVHRVAAWGLRIQTHPAAPVLVVGAYIVGGLVMFPVTLLTAATALAFPAGTAVAYTMLGSLSSAALTFGIGRLASRHTAPRLAGSRLGRMCQRLRRRGLLAVITFRILPVAPFTVVNLAAGALRIRFRDFMLGSLIGKLPGAVAITLFTDRLAAVLLDPRPRNLLLLVGVVVPALLAAAWLRRRLKRRVMTEAP